MQQKKYSRKQYLELFDEFYEYYNNSEKKNDIKSFWPITRIQCCYFLFLEADGKIDKSKANKVLKNNYSKPVFNDLKKIVRLYLKIQYLKNIYNGVLKNKVLLFGFLEHYDTYNNEKTNLYLTPLINELNKNKISYESFLISNCQSKYDKNYLYELFDVIFRYTSLVIKFNKACNKNAFTNATLLNHFLESKDIGFADHLSGLVYNTQIQQEIRFTTFKILLKITQPKVIWTYCFYDNSVMALIRAANKLKIPSIEYQHSSQSDIHQAYAKWPNANLYNEFFPKYFWLWNEIDGERIKTNFGAKNYEPGVIIGGNLAVIQAKETIEKEADYTNNGILVSLQGHWIPRFVEEVIANDGKYKWYFRLHPRYPNDKEKLDSFKKKFPDKVEVELANKLSLFELFTKVKCNITDFSGVALEAEAFGIKNIIIGKHGYETYFDKIGSLYFSFVDNEVDIKIEIDNLISKNINKNSHRLKLDNNIIKCFVN